MSGNEFSSESTTTSAEEHPESCQDGIAADLNQLWDCSGNPDILTAHDNSPLWHFILEEIGISPGGRIPLDTLQEEMERLENFLRDIDNLESSDETFRPTDGSSGCLMEPVDPAELAGLEMSVSAGLEGPWLSEVISQSFGTFDDSLILSKVVKMKHKPIKKLYRSFHILWRKKCARHNMSSRGLSPHRYIKAFPGQGLDTPTRSGRVPRKRVYEDCVMADGRVYNPTIQGTTDENCNEVKGCKENLPLCSKVLRPRVLPLVGTS